MEETTHRFQLHERKVVVIGGTTGIGRSAAMAFVLNGARVIVVGPDEQGCEDMANKLGEDGRAFCGDARNVATAREAIALCLDTWDGFDGLYHVAGGSGRQWGDGPLHELALDAWQKTLELNLTSVMLSNQAAIKSFLDRNHSGSVLNLSSVLGTYPAPTHFATHAYATAKAAVNGLTRTLAAHYAGNDIRVNAISPALVETPMSLRAKSNEEIMAYVKRKQPLAGGRIGKVNDLDGLACYFMSDQSRFTTGQIISVDGGWSLSEGMA